MMRFYLSLLAVVMCCGTMLAVPAKPVPFTHTQSDGTTVRSEEHTSELQSRE